MRIHKVKSFRSAYFLGQHLLFDQRLIDTMHASSTPSRRNDADRLVIYCTLSKKKSFRQLFSIVRFYLARLRSPSKPKLSRPKLARFNGPKLPSHCLVLPPPHQSEPIRYGIRTRNRTFQGQRSIAGQPKLQVQRLSGLRLVYFQKRKSSF